MRALKLSTARDIMVFMTDSNDHITGKTGLTLTVTLSKNGAAFASISPTVTERGNGWYSVSLTASHTDTAGDLVIRATATNADPADVLMQVKMPGVELGSDYYHAEIQFTRDQTNTQDEWTVTWFKNGVRLSAGISSPTLQLVKRADGTNHLASTAMTQIGSTGSYKLDVTGASRLTTGEAILALTAASIDSATREFSRIIGRDST